jgi:hypothetical protein
MTDAKSARSDWHAYAAAVPVVLVNSTAFIGQFAFLRAHVPWIIPGIVLIAATSESIGIYLAWHAHLAQKAKDTAMRLKLAAYGFAAVVGGLNYSHYAAPHWRPTALAVIMFIASAISPWLWGVYSRRVSRDQLMAEGLIERHAVRLGGTRWTWHPARSVRVTSWAGWHGVNDPARAIAHFADRYGTADSDPVRASRRRASVPAHTVPGILSTELVPAVPDSSEPDAVPLGMALAHALAQSPAVPVVLPETVPVPEIVPAPVSVPAPERAISQQAQDALGAGPDGPVAVMIAEPTIVAEAGLNADATLSGGRPPQDMIDQAELTLMTMQVDELPSVRAVARDLLGDPNQRRLAAKLLEARRAAGNVLATEPAGHPNASHNGSRTGPGMIASPVAYQPGGVNG